MRFLFRLVFALALLAAIGLAYVYTTIGDPYKGFEQPVFLEIRRGTPTSAIARELETQGVIRSSWMFVAARAFHRGETLQAGEYQFREAASPLDILNRLHRGDIYFTELLIPEGTNIFDAATLVAKESSIAAQDFLAAAKDPSLVRDLDPQAKTLEGYLFPSKYRVYRHTTAKQLCAQMVAEFRRQWAKLNASDAHYIVTLASLVEREAHLKADQPAVASVFANRLQAGMKLDCDPTTVYAALLENRYRGTIHQSDLASENPYNTYRHVGLPPGPIANPGLGALRAAANPPPTKYLFFVARGDGSGGHYFTENIKQHLAAVSQYRRATGQ